MQAFFFKKDTLEDVKGYKKWVFIHFLACISLERSENQSDIVK